MVDLVLASQATRQAVMLAVLAQISLASGNRQVLTILDKEHPSDSCGMDHLLLRLVEIVRRGLPLLGAGVAGVGCFSHVAPKSGRASRLGQSAHHGLPPEGDELAGAVVAEVLEVVDWDLGEAGAAPVGSLWPPLVTVTSPSPWEPSL